MRRRRVRRAGSAPLLSLLAGRKESPDHSRSRPAAEEERTIEDAKARANLFGSKGGGGSVDIWGVGEGEPGAYASIPSETITGVALPPNVEIESTESSMVASPVNMSGRTPILSDHRPASGEIMASATAPGVSTSPACPGESPLTSETSSGTKTSADTLASMLKYPTTTAAT